MQARVRSVVRRRAKHWLGTPVDPARSWRGTATTSAALRIQRYGGCEYRDMPLSHTVASEAGYPRHLARALAARDIDVEFRDRYAPTSDDLPSTAEQLAACMNLSAPPHVVLVQVNAIAAYRTLLGFGPTRSLVRDRVGRALGEHVGLAYRVANPVFRLGRPTQPLPALDGLDRFVDVVRQEWPSAAILTLGLLPALRSGAFDPNLMRRASDELLARAAALGAATLNLDDIIPPLWEHRCANGLNLKASGSGMVAQALERWLDDSGVLAPFAYAPAPSEDPPLLRT